MNISKYDFHDGSVFDIQRNKDSLSLSMESAEISDEELQDELVLSDQFTIKGKLHLEGIKTLKVNGKDLNETFKKNHDEGVIYSLNIESNCATLVLGWIDHAPKPYVETDLFKIEISGERIYWENIPNLINPYG